jgi:hypothetical protein
MPLLLLLLLLLLSAPQGKPACNLLFVRGPVLCTSK